MTKVEALDKAIALFKDQDNLALMHEIIDYVKPHISDFSDSVPTLEKLFRIVGFTDEDMREFESFESESDAELIAFLERKKRSLMLNELTEFLQEEGFYNV